ncbi:hypothetical protein [Fulvivirga ligni]|uniref:hypothetical protein n=1 Tax=Fulvivirga ligni TaxID=2904246 RepID=UPI001F3AA01D|nr:hypothetical protein [Fulvivirga ligni]UII20130.1 hypothetical protein LVD16_19990 [Fulvivirga ligni]
MRKLYIIILLAISIIACNDDSKDIKVNLRDSGTLAITLNHQGAAVSDVRFKLYPMLGEDAVLDEAVSDENGMVDFGLLNSGSYLIEAETTQGGLKYRISQVLQVLSGSDKNVTLDTEDYMGTLNVTTYSGSDIEGNVKLLFLQRTEENNNLDNFSEKLEAGVKATTDEDGRASVTMPSEIYFDIYFYTSSEDGNYYYYYQVDRADDKNISIDIDD